MLSPRDALIDIGVIIDEILVDSCMIRMSGPVGASSLGASLAEGLDLSTSSATSSHSAQSQLLVAISQIPEVCLYMLCVCVLPYDLSIWIRIVETVFGGRIRS